MVQVSRRRLLQGNLQEEMCEKKDCSTEGYHSEVVACDNTHRPMDLARGPLHGVREELFMTNSLNGRKCFVVISVDFFDC